MYACYLSRTYLYLYLYYVADDPPGLTSFIERVFVRGLSCSGFEFRGLAPLVPLPFPSHSSVNLRAQSAAADAADAAVCQLAVSLL